MDTHDAALQRLIGQIVTARHDKTSLEIRGGHTKAFYGNPPRGNALDVRPLRGISAHEPSELVVTARAGTPLAELEAALAAHDQCLPFEPPHWGGDDSEGGTVGGMVAAGLSGPARVSVGSVRDFVLGVTLLNGRAELLTFGGQVMKNVAGYDVSRLMAGSMGVLGVICEVSLKVLPRPAASATLEFELDEASALDRFNTWRRQPLPLNASAWHAGRLRVRLSGAQAAVSAARARLGGRALDADEAAAWWRSVRDHQHAFFAFDAAAFARGESLWRLSLPPAAPALGRSDEMFIEWHGAQRWWRTTEPPAPVRELAAQAGGHAVLFRGADRSAGVFAPLPEPLMRIHRGLKATFDPDGVFNPGRLISQL